MSQQQTRLNRNRSIRNAISTSLVSKGSSAILQFVSLPLAARVLGREEFGIFATISMSLFAIGLLQLGVGPALGKGISEASANSDREKEGRLYLSGAVLVCCLAALSVLLTGAVITLVPIAVLFGKEYAEWTEVMVPALWICMVLFSAELVVSHTDRVREGYMEASIANAWAAGGNLLGAIAVILGMIYNPTVSVLLIAIFVPNILVRIVNTVFLIRKRPYLISPRNRPDRATMVELIKDGVSFCATRSAAHLVEFNLCALIVGRIMGPGHVAVFWAVMPITMAYRGLLVMVGTPYWAALVDAKARGDHQWMIASTRHYYRYLVIISGLAAIVLIPLGPFIIEKWYGPEFVTNRFLFAAQVLFLLATGWRLVNHYVCIGLGRLHDTVWPILLGLALGLFLGITGLNLYGLWALFAGLSIGALMIPGVKLPALVLSEFSNASMSTIARKLLFQR
jgi:O-antigen/teichoic acid export membrane protein